MKIGINLLLWTDVPSKEHIPLLKNIKDWGFDGVEIPLDDMSWEDVNLYAEETEKLGLKTTGIVSMPAEKGNPISEDVNKRNKAEVYLKTCIDKGERLNCSVIAGPLYQGLGEFSGTGPTESEKNHCVEFFKKIAPYAGEKGIVLAGEAINRFETYFVNTVDQACEIIDRIDSPYFGLHVDTYHGNFEELNVCEAWRRAGKRIKHVHISENTRGIPGTGNAVYPDIFRTLKEIGYDDWLTIEGFGCKMPDLVSRLHIWRQMAPNDDDIAIEGYKYIAAMIGNM